LLANGLWIGITPPMLPKLTMVEETLMACYHCFTILIKLRYTNKGRRTCQHALKRNIVNFAQNPKSVIELLNILPSSLETLTNTIAIHFVGSSHPPIELVKSCKLLYVCRYAITIWLTWLKSNHIGYKNTSTNTRVLNTMLENDIPKPIMRSMFQSTNIELANAEHCTNIMDLHEQKRYDETKHVIETLNLIDFDGIDINQHEHMINTFQNLHCNQYFSYNHHITMIIDTITQI
jgi:hypothetical protein